MRKQTEDPHLQAEITQAIDTIQSVLDSANDAINEEHLAAAVVDLSERVDDWKSLKMESFGDLLRFGTFAVVKGDSGKDSEREVCITGIFLSIGVSFPPSSSPEMPRIQAAYRDIFANYESTVSHLPI